MADNQPSDVKFKLFHQCQLLIIDSPDLLDGYEATELSVMVEERGGKVTIHTPPSMLPSVEEFTHIVSSTIDFPDHDAACDALIPVVKPQWILTSIGKKKLLNPRNYNPDPKLFMNQVVVTCADIPNGDKDAIVGGVVAMGGLHTSKLASTVTHVVALTMDADKCQFVVERGLNVKIVLPHWFDDCLKLGKRIDDRPYTLPDPEILRAVPGTPVRAAENKFIVGATTPEPQRLPSPITPSHGRRQLNVFDKKKVLLSKDLEIGDHLLGSIQGLIRQGGGSLVADVPEADMFICRHRAGDDYIQASRLGKDVGNLSWLYHLITYNAWTSPFRRLLHYPTTEKGVPGFQDMRISLSNYAGEARLYLENLIAASGAECTKTLRQDNTHLITAHGSSEKVTAAKEWNLHIVNHLWLEDSYAKWNIQTISDRRYSHFPQRTNLGEVVGQTAIDRVALEENFFSDKALKALARAKAEAEAADEADAADESSAPDEAPAPSEVMKQKDSNALVVQKAIAKEMSPPPKPVIKRCKDRKKAAPPRDGTPKAATTTVNKISSDKKPQTPSISRFIGTGKENETPSSTSSRKSKEAATARLHEIAPDIALYEKETKRVGGVIYGGRRKSDQDRVTLSKKRSAEPDDEDEDAESVEVKRAKKSRPPVTVELLLSGYQRWKENQKLEASDKQHLRDLGILVVQDPSRCTHLAAPSIIRTSKFVNALAYAPKIINSKFVTDCLENDELLDPDDYPLVDRGTERKFSFTLAQAEINAKKNKNKLLKGKLIYCVENISGTYEVFKSIVEANGGQCPLFRGRAGITIPSSRPMSEYDNGEQERQGEAYLISGDQKEQMKLWPIFRKMAKGSRRAPKIVNSAWILDIAMSQEWRWAESYELSEENITDDNM